MKIAKKKHENSFIIEIDMMLETISLKCKISLAG